MADIRNDSRYSKAQLKQDENGVTYLDWFGDIRFDVSEFIDNFEYETMPSDTVFSIASRFYDSQRYFWVVCRANTIFNPFLRLVPGTKLVLPSLRTFRTEILGQV